MSTPTPRTDKMSESLLSKTFLTSYVTMQDFARMLERELYAERARVADLVADLNDACITLASAAEDCDDYAMQNTGFKLTAVREVLLQHIPNAAMKEGA